MSRMHADPSEYLSILTYAPAEAVKSFADSLIPELGEIEILSGRTVLTQLPQVGEVLVTELCVCLPDGTEGYSAILGTDQDHAAAVAILDAALIAYPEGPLHDQIVTFIDDQAALLSHEAESEATALETA